MVRRSVRFLSRSDSGHPALSAMRSTSESGSALLARRKFRASERPPSDGIALPVRGRLVPKGETAVSSAEAPAAREEVMVCRCPLIFVAELSCLA
jgi:hypothetical protein